MQRGPLDPGVVARPRGAPGARSGAPAASLARRGGGAAAVAVAVLTVLGTGMATAGTVHVHGPAKARGTVTSVDGSRAAGACGRPGSGGTFTVAAPSASVVVDVGPATTFTEHRVATPTFADLCVGDKAVAQGPLAADDTLSASQVAIVPPRPTKLSGPVTSVDGSAATGACGTGDDGSFTLGSGSTPDTVDVSPTTSVVERGADSSFAAVCVGDRARAQGALSGSELTAEHVVVVPPKPVRIAGPVTSVEGSAVPGTCATGGDGGFTLADGSTTYTVDVGPATTVVEHGAPASWASVCVGDRARADGTVSGTTVDAAHVVVVPPKPTQIAGQVHSVDGSAVSGGCGSGETGSFTVSSGSTTTPVEVVASTRFSERKVSSPTFADLCVGEKVRAVARAAQGGALEARRVVIVPPRPTKVAGPVESVDGSTASGTCGSGDTGSFTVGSGAATYTVDVAPQTVFRDRGVSAPSFHQLCVGDEASATGTVTSGTVVHAFDVVVTLP